MDLNNFAPGPGAEPTVPQTNFQNNAQPPAPKQPWWTFYKRLSKKQWTIIAAISVLLVGGILFALTRDDPPKQPVAVKTAPQTEPEPITSPLTGLEVSEADSKRPVTGVMIENSHFARPQSGLREAGVVFEGIAEAGITRFLALYQESKPKDIGPVRSVRPYFLQWSMGFDAPLAHVGGSPEALNNIKKWGARDLDQFFNAAYYHRISSRFAPHNMYTSMSNLDKAKKAHKWTTSKFTGFARKQEAPATKATTRLIDFTISSADFNVHYGYDKKNNAYLRSEGGARHIDAKTKKQLTPKVVIALIMPYGVKSDGYHSDYKTIGSGKMLVFQDGKVQKGMWKKTGNKSQFQFLDTSGAVLKLNPGQTWITALDGLSKAKYK